MPLADRSARADWDGTLASGGGSVTAGSGAFSGLEMDFASRSAAAGATTSPEELLAASAAGCYAMTLSVHLTREGHKPGPLDVQASCSLDRDGDWFTITAVRLAVSGSAEGLDDEAFAEIARAADRECAVNNALRATVDVQLEVTAG